MIKILLAEDTSDLNRALTVVLQHEGYSVDSVFDGEEALEHLRSDAYDTVILDIMMPKADGLEVLSRMRSEGNTVPVLLLLILGVLVVTGRQRSAARRKRRTFEKAGFMPDGHDMIRKEPDMQGSHDITDGHK